MIILSDNINSITKYSYNSNRNKSLDRSMIMLVMILSFNFEIQYSFETRVNIIPWSALIALQIDTYSNIQ